MISKLTTAQVVSIFSQTRL